MLFTLLLFLFLNHILYVLNIMPVLIANLTIQLLIHYLFDLTKLIFVPNIPTFIVHSIYLNAKLPILHFHLIHLLIIALHILIIAITLHILPRLFILLHYLSNIFQIYLVLQFLTIQVSFSRMLSIFDSDSMLLVFKVSKIFDKIT